MGGSSLAYWSSNLALDYIVYNICQIVFYLIIVIINLKPAMYHLFDIILMFLCFGVSLISLAYLLSCIFEKSKTVYKWYSTILLFLF